MVLDLKHIIVSIVMVAWAAACVPVDASLPTATVVPTPISLRAQISPALKPIAPVIQACADQNVHVALFVEALPAQTNPPTLTDVFFFLPSEQIDAEYIFALGKEHLVVIVNRENEIRSLSARTIGDIFSGRIRRWSDLPGGTGSSDSLIQLWSYDESDPLRKIFTDIVFQAGGTFSPDFSVAPGPAAMLEAIATEKNAIGYLPQGWLDETIRAVQVETQSLDRWQVPILAGVIEEPGPAVAGLLGCLQNGEGQRRLQERYSPLE